MVVIAFSIVKVWSWLTPGGQIHIWFVGRSCDLLFSAVFCLLLLWLVVSFLNKQISGVVSVELIDRSLVDDGWLPG